MSAIEVSALVREYGSRRALDGIDFTVAPGEIFGLLGPNGGGKTTLFRILCTLLRPTSGRAAVLGHDTVAAAAAVRRAIGVVFQSSSLDPKLPVSLNLEYQGALYGYGFRESRRRAALMLEAVGLSDRVRDRVEDLSGGLRRRAEIAKGMMHEPKVLLLDEPTTGLDPGGRHDVRRYLERLRDDDGVTSLLTTHLMEEAERCDHVAILDRGRIVALGSPTELKAQIGGDVLTLETPQPEELRHGIEERFGIAATVFEGTVRLEHSDGHQLIPRLVEAFPERIGAVALGKPTLEDVFIRRTGHRFWSEES